MYGFTLIELMVTITILVVLSGVSISAYLNFNKLQSVDTDVRDFVSEVNRVRSLASSQTYPPGCVSLKGYNLRSIDVDGVLSGVVVTAMCDPVDIVQPTENVLKSSYFASSISTDSLPFDITFTPGNGYTSTGSDVIINLRYINDPTTQKSITVSAYSQAVIN